MLLALDLGILRIYKKWALRSFVRSAPEVRVIVLFDNNISRRKMLEKHEREKIGEILS